MRMRKREIKQKLKEMQESVLVVEKNLPSHFGEFLSLGLAKDGIYKRIEFAIECIIDICNIINSDLELGMPESEDQILDNLEKNKIFDRKTISLIQEMKKFRNILIHKYGEINDEQAFENIKDGLKDFETVINEIEKFLKKHK